MSEKPKLRVLKGQNKPAKPTRNRKPRAHVRVVRQLQSGGLQATHVFVGSTHDPSEEE